VGTIDRYSWLASTFPTMNRPARSITMIAAMFALVAAGCTSDVGTDASAGEPSEIAPIFAVETTNGDFDLSDHLANDGRPVFLNLWASWCFPCREEMPAIDLAAAANPGVKFLGVSVQDSRDDAIAFGNEIGVAYELGFDDDDVVNDAYNPLGLPASYIISADGIILEEIFGKVTEEDLAEKFAKHFG
jgi:thiol-disulfide isomerase/thioredoxin